MDVRRDGPDSTPSKRVIPTDEARQGVTGHHVRYVLLIATVCVIIGFALVWFYYFAP